MLKKCQTWDGFSKKVIKVGNLSVGYYLLIFIVHVDINAKYFLKGVALTEHWTGICIVPTLFFVIKHNVREARFDVNE